MKGARGSRSGTWWVCLALLVASSGYGDDYPPLEAYAALPQVSLAALSPDGGRVTVRQVKDGMDLVSVFDLSLGEHVNMIRADQINTRSLSFISKDSVLIKASDTRRSMAVRGAFEYTGAYHFDLRSGETKLLLRGADEIYAYQSGLGRVVGSSPDGAGLYMPAWVQRGGSGEPTGGLLEVPLHNGRPDVLEYGTRFTIDWFMGPGGAPLAREDFDGDEGLHVIWRYEDGEATEALYRMESPLPAISVNGVTPDFKSLVFISGDPESDGDELYLLDVATGAISEAGLSLPSATVAHVMVDVNRVVHGVRYDGFKPRYRFFDEALDQRVHSLQARLPNTSAELVSWSADFQRLLFHVSGQVSSGAYALFDGVVGPTVIGRSYPSVPWIPVEIIEYAARDGLTIPALVTAQEAVRQAGGAPLIVLPHGGPEDSDGFGFDWMAQYLASRGYLVLQPQFRGSSGFGRAFTQAGLGEWGRAMSTDLDDGVGHLVAQGLADPERVCIVGASYGGYAALAAGAFSPERYRCVVSIAGVSDLRDMLRDERRESGEHQWNLAYWELQFGADAKDRELLEARSPAEHADRFQAPVLLIHGKDDTVVPRSQSKTMERALKRADKSVRLEVLKGEDHWLTQAETRLETLRLVDGFVAQHLQQAQ